MSHRHTLAVLALVLPLAACGGAVDDDNSEGMGTQPENEVEVTSTIGRPEQHFEVQEVAPATSTEIQGQSVDDPAMELSYKWQGTSYAPVSYTHLTLPTNREV